MRSLLILALAGIPRLAMASNDGALGTVFLIWVDQYMEQTKTLCIARDPATASQTSEAWDHWAKAHEPELKVLREKRMTLLLQWKKKALNPLGKESVGERAMYLAGPETIAAIGGGVVMQQFASGSDKKVADFCQLSRNSWLEADSGKAIQDAVFAIDQELDRLSQPEKQDRR